MKTWLSFTFVFLAGYSFTQGYPEDTLWYNEAGHLKDTFVVTKISFELAQKELIEYHPSSPYLEGDSLYVYNMYQMLDSLAKQIKKDSSSFIVEGHTDCRGSDKYSYRLSEARAQTIYNYLIDKGVSEEKLSFKGREGDFPRRLNRTVLSCTFIHSQKNKEHQEHMHQLNRRISIVRITR